MYNRVKNCIIFLKTDWDTFSQLMLHLCVNKTDGKLLTLQIECFKVACHNYAEQDVGTHPHCPATEWSQYGRPTVQSSLCYLLSHPAVSYSQYQIQESSGRTIQHCNQLWPSNIFLAKLLHPQDS